MFQSVRSRRRAAAALTAIVCAVWLHGHRASAIASAASTPPTFESSALVAALPSVLSPPAVQPGSHLVSMIAEDIDADGDLDVIANDGSLDLIVWTNDGSGRLVRLHSRPGSGFRSEPAAPSLSEDGDAPASVVPASEVSFDIAAPAGAPAPESAGFRSTQSDDRLTPAFVSPRASRGPPASPFLL